MLSRETLDEIASLTAEKMILRFIDPQAKLEATIDGMQTMLEVAMAECQAAIEALNLNNLPQETIALLQGAGFSSVMVRCRAKLNGDQDAKAQKVQIQQRVYTLLADVCVFSYICGG